MPLKSHHKWLIGSFSSLVIIFMITSGIFTYMLFIRQEVNFNTLDGKISELQTEFQTNVNEISTSLIQTKEDVKTINTELGNIGQEFDLLKASAGEDFSGVIEQSVKSVVTIRTDISQGTGFIITTDGYIVTNAHVLSGGSVVEAITYEQQRIPAQFLGYDENLDLALLKINGNFERLRLENSNDIQVGEKVIAIGNPLGLQFSVSQGIVSAIHRAGPNGLEIYIQTDAALNPGNSGGPLINTKGKAIGINNFKVGNSESLGFALESNYIKEFVNNLAIENLGGELI